MKNKFYLFVLSTLIFCSCSKKDDITTNNNNSTSTAPVACIDVDTTITNDSAHVFTFSSCSQNATRFEWDFGDGSYSLIANPTHIFYFKGQYTVRLTAYNAAGTSNTISKVITIGNWFYSLSEVKYTFSNNISLPVAVEIYYSLMDTIDTISTLSQLPFELQFNDSPIYDLIDTIGNVGFQVKYISTGIGYGNGIYVTPSLLTNNELTKKLLFPSGDTATVSLYFKIVHR